MASELSTNRRCLRAAPTAPARGIFGIVRERAGRGGAPLQAPGETMIVQREEKGQRGAFYIERDGERLAEQTFSTGPDGKIVIIDHTEVCEKLRGQGIARQLTLAAAEWARNAGVKVVPVCPFAKAVFDEDPTIQDVLAR